ncbi:MAG: undecaprenyldiphospho-muramoylpentapeptide beta-N-acetylglucosaminyltransferase [Bacteroidales bacterium]|jgi:UDP-N-acetylglucosamine--N-acetylmuramyl-(pentapeptide) pyrophosphoryl-undecaprenol N-acetylglucosamine transferase
MKAIISGGGTGGHIFPAVSIANAIKAKYNDAEILFIGAKGRMEMEKVPQAGYKIEGLWISGLQRRLTWKNLLFPIKVICSTLKARKLIKQFNPDIVIGVGGFASGPTLQAASKLHIPTLIQEQNSYPGITNKMLAKHVSKICVAYDNMTRWFEESKICFTGNPVRQNIVDILNKRDKGFEHFGLNANKKTVLVVGGSLGALTINESISINLNYFVDNDIQILWQTGKSYYSKAKEQAKEIKSNNIKVFEFIYEMDLAYSVADVIISRAGAIAISELCCIGKPTILVPSPNVAEDHQTKNAMALVNKNATILVKDIESREKLINELDLLIKNEEKQGQLSENIIKLGVKDADKRILNIIEEMLGC